MRFDAELFLLHPRTRKTAEEKLEPFSERPLVCGVREQVRVGAGLASPEFIQAAQDENVDCIVIATQGYSELTHFLMSSTTERAIRHVPCSVRIVRLKEASTKK